MKPFLHDFPDFFENSILATCITNYSGRIIHANTAYCALYESSKDELIGQAFTIHFSHLSGEQKGKIIREYQEFIRRGAFDRGDFEVKKSDGERIVVEVIRQLVEVDKEPFVITILQDITEKYDLSQAVKGSEKLLKAIFESGYQAKCIIDKDFKVVDLNEKSKKLSEKIFNQAFNIDVSMLEFTRGFHRESFIKNVKRAFAGEVVEVVREFKVAGNSYWLRFLYEPLANNEGVIDKVFVNSVDITRTIRAEEEVRVKNEQLQQAMQLQKDQMYTISHDLRSPLGSIFGITEVLEKEKDPEKVRELLGYIRNLSEKGLNIIDELSQVGRIEHGMVKPALRLISLSSLLKEVTNSYKIAMQRKVQVLESDIADDIKINADYKMIYSVVDNLLGNAIKYSPRSGIIRLGLTYTDGSVTIEIKDQGYGIIPEEMPRLFGKFSRLSARPTGGEKSSGLGLYIAKNFVEAHGGRISAESKGARQGTTFRVELPVGKVSEGLK